jgi:ABC-type glycerol-3-phosphate transport system permease component
MRSAKKGRSSIKSITRKSKRFDRLVKWTGKAFLYFLVLAVGAIMILPFYWMVVTAVSPIEDITAFPPRWTPSHLTSEHFKEALHKAPFLIYYRNSLAVAIISVGCSVLLGLFAGYAFAVYRFPLQNFFFILILSTVMIPFQVTCVALYVLLAKMKWVDTIWGILAPNFASALGVFLIRQSIQTVPKALIDAARMDGASEIRIVLTIVAPLIKTTLATVSMILFLNSWNDFLWPVIAINSVNLRTIPVGIALFKDPYHIEYGPLMAATVISTAPMLIAYFLSQKYVIKGIALSGLKG